MKSIGLIAPVLTQSGYGVHSRQVARWLLDRPDAEVKILAVPWGNTPWLLNSSFADGLVGRIMSKTVPNASALSQCDVVFQLQLPNEWSPFIGKKAVGMSAVVETDVCVPQWIDACNRMAAVVVPSKHAEKCLKASGEIKVPLHVIHESYPDVTPTQLDIDLPAENNFLMVAQLTNQDVNLDRKNIINTIKWLLEEFEGRQDVGIVLKTNLGRNTKIDQKIATNSLRQLLSAFRKGDFPRFKLLHGDMDDAEVMSLYKHPRIKALVSATRGEGFGLPLLEAAASGLPVIATNWSGHLDFLGQGKFLPVSYDLKQVPQQLSSTAPGIFSPTAKWAEPKEEDFKRRVRKFLESPSVPQQWATELATKLQSSFNFESARQKYESVLESL